MNLLWWTKPKLAYNESYASIHWETGDEDSIVMTYESGIYYNHELSIAVAETDSLQVEVYEYERDWQPANHIGRQLELRTEPTPIGESSAVWDALETQDIIASAGTRTSRMTAPSRFDDRTWRAVKVWTFIAGLVVLAAIVMWSLKLGSDAIDTIEERIETEYQRQLESGDLFNEQNGAPAVQPTPTIDYGWKWIPPPQP